MNRRQLQSGQGGFTLIELLIAMAVFSFLLMIVVAGFINVVQLHNQAVAVNIAQDNARTAMDALVQTVRDSTGVANADASGNFPNGSLPANPALDPYVRRVCLNYATGQELVYVDSNGILKRADGCTTLSNVRSLTAANVIVTSFAPHVTSVGPTIVKPEVEFSLTVASNSTSGLTQGSGAATKCNTGVQQRTFCSVVTLTSGATPR